MSAPDNSSNKKPAKSIWKRPETKTNINLFRCVTSQLTLPERIAHAKAVTPRVEINQT
jgi:hypothetical protein